jgi:hypothetical protein
MASAKSIEAGFGSRWPPTNVGEGYRNLDPEHNYVGSTSRLLHHLLFYIKKWQVPAGRKPPSYRFPILSPSAMRDLRR